MITLGKLSGKSLRSYQRQAIQAIKRAFASGKKYVVLQAPPGIGKTALAVETMKDEPFYYLCYTKELQDQIKRDYSDIIPVIKGRNNYPCHMYGTAEECIAPFEYKSWCISQGICEYHLALDRALKSDYACTNFSYFFSKTDLKPRNLIVDEADVAEQVLTEHISFTLSERQMLRNHITPPRKKTVISAFVPWAKVVIERLETETCNMEAKVERVSEKELPLSETERAMIKKYNWMTKTLKKLAMLCEYLQKDEKSWIYYADKKGIILKPKWLNKLAKEYLFDRAGKILFMSATMPPPDVFCFLYGLNITDIEYIALPSPFPKDKRPIIMQYSYQLNHKILKRAQGMEEVQKMVSAVKEILQDNQGQRGIIHTVSYLLANELKDMDERLIFHDDSNGKKDAVMKFMSRKDAVLVSPSSERGIDLHDDLCRFIIWLKCPWPNLGDRLISARRFSGKFGQKWYVSEAIRMFIQGCGRGMRHKDDWCKVYVLDKEFEKILKPSLLPKYIREALVWEF